MSKKVLDDFLQGRNKLEPPWKITGNRLLYNGHLIFYRPNKELLLYPVDLVETDRFYTMRSIVDFSGISHPVYILPFFWRWSIVDEPQTIGICTELHWLWSPIYYFDSKDWQKNLLSLHHQRLLYAWISYVKDVLKMSSIYEELSISKIFHPSQNYLAELPSTHLSFLQINPQHKLHLLSFPISICQLSKVFEPLCIKNSDDWRKLLKYLWTPDNIDRLNKFPSRLIQIAMRLIAFGCIDVDEAVDIFKKLNIFVFNTFDHYPILMSHQSFLLWYTNAAIGRFNLR